VDANRGRGTRVEVIECDVEHAAVDVSRTLVGQRGLVCAAKVGRETLDASQNSMGRTRYSRAVAWSGYGRHTARTRPRIGNTRSTD